jgi:hypothetical protein
LRRADKLASSATWNTLTVYQIIVVIVYRAGLIFSPLIFLNVEKVYRLIILMRCELQLDEHVEHGHFILMPGLFYLITCIVFGHYPVAMMIIQAGGE